MSQVLVSSSLAYDANEKKVKVMNTCEEIIKELNAIIKTLESQPQS